MKPRSNTVVGLDIGTTKICAVVAEETPEGLHILGFGTHPASGLRKGVVINIESTVQSIKRAVEEAELMSGREIRQVYAGIAGGHIQAFNSHGVIALKDQEVTPNEVRRVIDAAKAVAIPMDREVLHIIPQEFIIDDQDGINEPVGMCGVRLEAHVHVITGAVAAAQNIVKCCNRAGLDVADIILEPLASAEAVLTDDERELGVALVDMGGGTTDIVVIAQGSVKHTSVLTLGGNHVTSDIAMGLRTPSAEAEKIKRKHACALISKVGKDETIEVPGVGGRRPRILNRRILAEIVEPRAEEIFSLVRMDLQKRGVEEAAVSGVVLCGGASLLEGSVELAEQVFGLPVRRGMPRPIEGLVDQLKDPSYATGVGLVEHAVKNRSEQNAVLNESDENLFGRITQKMKGWFQHFFFGDE
ncbi:MAG: cell division protein FtsA [Deltaproteobacteria bacterium]|nr:MAG: cell division protein FtsA [Deltaproteobacteria bacterium]